MSAVCFQAKRAGWGKSVFICLRKKGHIGQHWARGFGGRIVKRWDR